MLPGPVHAPSCSHDGRRIAYIRDGGTSTGDRIEIATADGTGWTMAVPPLENPARVGEVNRFVVLPQVRWGADDTALYFRWALASNSGNGISRIDLATGVVTYQVGFWALHFDIASDGALAIEDWTNGECPCHWVSLALPDPGPTTSTADFTALELTFATGGWVVGEMPTEFPRYARRLLTTPVIEGRCPAWSKDGSRVAFAGGGSLTEDPRLWIVGRNGENGRFLDLGGKVDALTWSPIGTSLAYASAGSVWHIDAITGERHRLFEGSDPDWSGTTRTGR
jgi:hypothetical protein